MNFRLRTSKYTEEKLKYLQSTTNLNPNILSRLAISLSVKLPTLPEINPQDANGLEFNRNTLTGEYDEVFKILLTQHAKREISDEEFFPNLFNSHLERGIDLLESEYKHAGNYEKFIINMLSMEKG
ncbi:DNA sulfur modification protein DndE [Marinococcus halophilus]|uniref:DNA sulfur modification protein DndE n=1 Tax=Marinococcus halophilus TaxID=1371 RepID=UPI0009A808A0|nr:DNA sulfur modification protein DndE [Marinococcus halophilus]